MDGKERIVMAFNEQECLDLSVSYTPACSIYIALDHGIKKIEADIQEMNDYLKFINSEPIGPDSMFKTIQEKIDATGNVNQQRDVAKMAFDNSTKFKDELQRVILELDPQKVKKNLIIAPPNWNK
jgi:hypothetical protein